MGRNFVRKKRVETGWPNAPVQFPGIGPLVQIKPEILIPHFLKTVLAEFRSCTQFRLFVPSKNGRKIGKTFAVEDIKAGKPHIGKAHQVRFRIKRHVVVHRRVVLSGFKDSPFKGVDPEQSPMAFQHIIIGIGAEAYLSVFQHTVSGKPAVPVKQIVKKIFHKPFFPKLPVKLPHRKGAYRRLGTVPAFEAVRRAKVGNKTRLGLFPGDGDGVGIGKLPVFKHGHHRGKIGVPVKKHISSPGDVPEPRNGRTHLIVLRLVDRVPGKAGPHRVITFRKLSVFFCFFQYALFLFFHYRNKFRSGYFPAG